MGLTEWWSDSRRVISEEGVFGVAVACYYVYVGLWLTVSTRLPLGTNVYDRDWELLVVLDACRVDALRAVADEYDFIDDVEAITSVGSTTAEWVSNTFDRNYRAEIGRTAYVTANPHSQTTLRDRKFPPQYFASPATWPAWDPADPDEFRSLEEVWRDANSERLGVAPPRATTDQAIRTGRRTDADRIVVHYMQPHAPYIADYVRTDDTVPEAFRSPFEALRSGRLSRESAWAAYLDNLRLVLDEVELLLRNVDAEAVAITADHGEAFGECGFYEHPVGCPHPVVKRVPWVRTTATDTGDHEPADHAVEEVTTDVREQLAALGYG